MSEYGDLVKAKCDAFADRVVKLNDYLLKFVIWWEYFDKLSNHGRARRRVELWN